MLVMAGAVAQAQQPNKVRRIGYLSSADAISESTRLEAILLALRNLGYTEGQNIAFERIYAKGKLERHSELAAGLVRRKVEIIVVLGGTLWVRAAKNATKTIPIVMVGTGSDPVETGLIESLARPGGNVTGFSSLNPELSTKRLEILKDVVPKLARVGFLQQPGALGPVDRTLKDLTAAALALKLKMTAIETEAGAKGLESAFQTAKQKQMGAIMTGSGRVFFAERRRIVELAGKHRFPAIYFQSEFVDDGGLMSYGVDYTDLYRRAAVYVDKILKGAKPGDLPVQQATKFEFVINLKAAK